MWQILSDRFGHTGMSQLLQIGPLTTNKAVCTYEIAFLLWHKQSRPSLGFQVDNASRLWVFPEIRMYLLGVS